MCPEVGSRVPEMRPKSVDLMHEGGDSTILIGHPFPQVYQASKVQILHNKGFVTCIQNIYGPEQDIKKLMGSTPPALKEPPLTSQCH